MASRLKEFLDSHHFRLGLPLIAVTVAGSFILREFATARYEFRKINRSRLYKLGPEKRNSMSVEDHYQRMKSRDIDNWEIVKVPKPSYK